ncbi:cysteine protease [Apiospora arundinis]|uniref:Cysteine protease n=1 Tax=Apiospora arundinis TaxID=335852 RepID=A0ABR2IFY4_9PEZI
MAAQSSRSQSPDVMVQIVEVGANHGDTRDDSHSEFEFASSEDVRVESCSAYLMDFPGGRDTASRCIVEDTEHLRREIRDRSSHSKAKLIVVVHGLPVDYVGFLRDSSLIQFDLVDSIARRRPSRYAKKYGDRHLSYEYPEQLALGGHGASRSPCNQDLSKVSSSVDLLGDPPQYSLSDPGREVAICRATLRVSTEYDGKAHVLLLDRSLWRNLPHFRKPMVESFVTKYCACDTETKHAWHLDELTHSKEEPSLEHRIWAYLEDDADFSERTLAKESSAYLLACFTQCVYACWAEFLDTLTLEGDAQIYMSLLQQIQRSLERNIDAELHLKGEAFSGSDWQGLLERLERKVRLAAHLSPAAVIQMPAAPEPVQAPSTPQPAAEVISSKLKEAAPTPEAEENQRSLDRVTYLGGVLLPMTIVSGILAMGDTFGPTGDMFYVFWATAVPLTLLTLVIIYADSIRRVEVWIEEAGSSFESPATSSGRLMGKKKKPLRHQGRPVSDLEQAVPYSETITIDYGTTETATQKISEPVTYMAEEPVIIAQPEEQGAGGDGQEPRVWKKEELGWLGACKTILGIYKLPEMKKRPWTVHTKTTTTTTTLE